MGRKDANRPAESWWKRVLAWAEKQYEIPVSPQSDAHPDKFCERPPFACAFCESRQAPQDQSVSIPYPIWKCPCGALGSGGWLPDLDDVGDHILHVLGIKASVSEPCIPTDHPAISIQRYDVNKVEHEMTEILKRNGYEFRTVKSDDPNSRMFWVRASKEKSEQV